MTRSKYVLSQQTLVKLAERRLRKFWNSLDLTDGVATRESLERFWPLFLSKYGDVAATLAADRFEELTGLRATMVRPVDVERANARMRWAVDPLFTGEGDAYGRMALLSDELVKQPGRSTMIRSSSENGIQYARVTSGDACTFCVMLASRGAVYASEYAANQLGDYHGACNCSVEPVANAQDMDRLTEGGYDPDALREQWQEQVAAADAAREAKKAKAG